MSLFQNEEEERAYCLACISIENREIHDKVCYARRQMEICPQIDVIEKLKKRLLWLEESRNMEKDDEYQAPSCGTEELADS